MAILIREVISEIVISSESAASATPSPAGASEDMVDEIVRRATERVLAQLRYEWDL